MYVCVQGHSVLKSSIQYTDCTFPFRKQNNDIKLPYRYLNITCGNEMFSLLGGDCSLVNQTTFLGGDTYRLEIISAPLGKGAERLSVIHTY